MKRHLTPLLLLTLAAPALAQSPTAVPLPPAAVPAVPVVDATGPTRAVVLAQESSTRGAAVSVSSRPTMVLTSRSRSTSAMEAKVRTNWPSLKTVMASHRAKISSMRWET